MGVDGAARWWDQRRNGTVSARLTPMLVTPLLTLMLLQAGPVSHPTPPIAPLLSDGSLLTAARGEMVRPHAGDPWHFRMDSTTVGSKVAVRDLVLMPSRVLEDMERAQERAGGHATMVVTGEVALFDGRNWLMPRHAELLAAPATREVPSEVPADPSTDAALPEDDSMRSSGPAGDSIADIVADLQNSVALLPQTVDDGVASDAMTQAEPDGTLIVSRRGRLLRGHHGAWVFVFDADAWGTGDEPAVILPSPALKNLIKNGRRSDYREPVHLSGSISTYRGRKFIVPTASSNLYERENLSR